VRPSRGHPVRPSRAASAAMSSPSAREGGARLAPEVGGLSDVGAVWHHGPGSQSDVDLAERAAQDGLVAAQDARDARESLLCDPRAIPCSQTRLRPRARAHARAPRAAPGTSCWT
jgi:hypothetical protein